MLRLAAFVVTMLAVAPAAAEEVVAGLSQNRVSITANFDGSEILIFGAVKRERPVPPDAAPLQVIIAVAGPDEPVIVRRKERRAGIWVNAQELDVPAAPSFYAVATSTGWSQALSDAEDLRHHVSIERAIGSVGITESVLDVSNFTDAIIRIRKESGLYQVLENKVHVEDETLFNAAIDLPSNLTEGLYQVRIYLTRDGRVVDAYTSDLDVQKVGLERWIFSLANEQPVIYGFLSLFIAIAAGWSASAVFRYLKS